MTVSANRCTQLLHVAAVTEQEEDCNGFDSAVPVLDSMRLLALQMFTKCENVHTEYIC